VKSLRWRLLRAQYATRKVSHRATRTRRGHLATYAGSDHPAAAETAFAAIRENPQLNWSFVQRGLWVHGVRALMDTCAFASRSACPTGSARSAALAEPAEP
jgi:hypothetical protein